jgi:hypothetical protein
MRNRAVNGRKNMTRSTMSTPKESRIRFVMVIVIPPIISNACRDSWVNLSAFVEDHGLARG